MTPKKKDKEMSLGYLFTITLGLWIIGDMTSGAKMVQLRFLGAFSYIFFIMFAIFAVLKMFSKVLDFYDTVKDNADKEIEL